MTLSANDISLILQGKTILDHIDLEAHPGQVTAIVGPNGSGKTSLLRVMTGEEKGGGQTWLNGIEVTRKNAPQLALMRGVLPQTTRIAFPFKAVEVVRIGHHAGIFAGRADIPDLALRAVGLEGFGPRFYQDLSGGEQQRVQLARVLAQIWQPVQNGQSCWLFLDEPVASLDIGHQLAIMKLLKEFTKRGGGVIVVMHDLNLTAMFADQVVLMQSGSIVSSGAPDQVLTDDTLSIAYNCLIRANVLPHSEIPFILPQSAGEFGRRDNPSSAQHDMLNEKIQES